MNHGNPQVIPAFPASVGRLQGVSGPQPSPGYLFLRCKNDDGSYTVLRGQNADTSYSNLQGRAS